MIVLFNKPFGVLTKFTDATGRATLSDYIDIPNIYAAGRLDKDSEGLLLLTDDGGLQHRLTDPATKRAKTYLVQLDGALTAVAADRLAAGVVIKGGRTLPAQVRRLPGPPDWLWPRVPPIRVRRDIPTSWASLTIREGRNRQIRHMTAAVGFPTLRLIRTQIADYRLDGLQPGEYRIL